MLLLSIIISFKKNVQHKIVQICYIDTRKQTEESFTKPLDNNKNYLSKNITIMLVKALLPHKGFF